MKSFAATWNWSLSAMTFLMSLPKVFRRMIEQKDLEWSYVCLLGLGIVTIVDLLKWFGQYPRMIQALAMLVILLRQSSCLRMDLRYHHVNLSSSGTNKLLHLFIAYLSSSLENRFQKVINLLPISLRTSTSTCLWSTVLNEEWRAFQRLLGKRHGWLSYLMASVVDNFCLLTQSISSHGPQLLFTTSWILSLKKDLLVVLTTFLYIFQFSGLLVVLYLSKAQPHSSFHHCLECFVILIHLAFLF